MDFIFLSMCITIDLQYLKDDDGKCEGSVKCEHRSMTRSYKKAFLEALID